MQGFGTHILEFQQSKMFISFKEDSGKYDADKIFIFLDRNKSGKLLFVFVRKLLVHTLSFLFLFCQMFQSSS